MIQQPLDTDVSERSWLIGDSVSQGYPIHLRRPNIMVSEYGSLAEHYPVLIIGTLQLADVKDNGLPESGYNESLAALDFAITDHFRSSKNGVVGLVETFAAKRTFYLYVTGDFDLGSFTDLLSTAFPDSLVTWEQERDLNWRLLRGYASEFQFA